jgi:hypothetical protein
MAASKTKCPKCGLVFDVPAGSAGSVACPICETPCPASANEVSLRAAPRQPARGEAAPSKKPRTRRSTKAEATPSKWLLLAAVLLAAAIAAGVVLLGGFVLANRWLRPARQSSPAVARNTETAKPTSEPAKTTDGPLTPIIEPAPPKPPAPMPDPANPPRPKQRELTEDERKVNEAVEAGIAHLKRLVEEQNFDPRTANPSVGRAPILFAAEHEAGIAGLVGLTLLECGVPPEEEHVVKLAKAVRAHQAELNHTYSLALVIYFLERLGDPKDRPLIETYAMRLVAGQTAAGAWSYNCPILTAAEELTFVEYLRANAHIGPGTKARPRGAENLPAKLKATSVVVWQRGGRPAGAPGVFAMAAGDNSNTQFALLGLWVAKRVGVPTQPSLNFVAQHFRQTQCPDGGWSYQVAGGPPMVSMQSTPSMTCAGLLGLAVGRGVTPDEPGKKQPARPDAVMARGLRALDAHIKPEMTGGEPLNKFGGIRGRNDYYLYWSLERVAVIYDLKVVAGREWYPWLSKLLVAQQKPDGSWKPAIHDDCFALLILRRVNVAKDLTSSLRSINIKDIEKAPPPKKP